MRSAPSHSHPLSARAAMLLLLALNSLLCSLTPLRAQWASQPNMFVEQWVPSGGARYVGLQFADAQSGFVIGAVRAANVSRVNYGVLRTTNGGLNWTSTAAIYPDNNPQIAFDLETLSARSASDVWVAGHYNDNPPNPAFIHLARSADGGANWQTQRLFESTIFNFRLARPSAQVGIIAGADQAEGELSVYRSTDNGANWTNVFRHPVTQEFFLEGITQISFLTSSVGLAAPLCYYFHSAGRPFVYRTTDGGANWVKVELEANAISDRFGTFVLRQLVIGPSDEVYALTTNGLYVSTTLGASWQRLSGLPSGFDASPYEQLIATGVNRLELLRAEPGSGQLTVTSLTREQTSWQANTVNYPIPQQHGTPLSGQAASTGPGTGVSLLSRSLFRSPSGTTQLEPRIDEATSLRVYPNPASSQSTIEAEIKASGMAQLELLSSAGQRLQHYTIMGGSTLRQSIDVSQLPAGLYLLRLTQGGHSRSARLVVQH